MSKASYLPMEKGTIRCSLQVASSLAHRPITLPLKTL
jgi:hypothetical protein